MSTPTLVLLHGALGSARQMAGLAALLKDDVPVHTWDFPGHGGAPVPDAGYSMADLVAGLEHWLDASFTQPVIVFGYSMGGYAATVLACRRPDLIHHVLTLGTKWSWSPDIAAREVRMLDPEVIREKVPALADMLADRHAPQDWTTIVQATRHLLEGLGQDPLLRDSDLRECAIPVDILWGSEDRMVSREESERVAGILPHGQFYALAGQRHPFEQVDLHILHDRLAKLFSIQ